MNNQSKNTWLEYPRPQFKRDSYIILNGTWQLNGEDITIPYPPQSELSRYKGIIGDELTYTHTFNIPSFFNEGRILLNFGAVDQVADIYINDIHVGNHIGGYLPFSFDITDVIDKKGSNHLTVKVIDTLSTEYPYGKQSKNRGGMWYTPVSGIWQTVWLENVPTYYIKNLKLTTDMSSVHIALLLSDNINTEHTTIQTRPDNFSVVVSLPGGSTYTKQFNGASGTIDFTNEFDDDNNSITPILWSPDNPYLYNMTVTYGADTIHTYFALRKIDIQSIDGINRVCLNNTPIFMHGVLDQGYFMKGIYLPDKSNEYEKDILRMKELGFNTLRKHIKIEPEQFYYYCDQIGMLVIQDMVNSGPYSFIKDTVLPNLGFKKRNDSRNKSKDTARKELFEKNMLETIEHLYNHPCIISYTIFNEGWGQFESDRMYELAKSYDNSRLYDSTSGWFAGKHSDFDSEHIYFRNKKLKPKNRPMLLSECGGFTYKDEAHLFNPDKSYGYGNCKDTNELTDRIINMYKTMVIPAINKGLCGCIYTQLSDVEDEINGIYTYDRAVCKVDKDKMKELSKEIIVKLS